MKTTIIEHPVVAERLARLRDETTSRAEFRRLLGDLAYLLVYEATRNDQATTFEVTTPLGPSAARRPAEAPLLVPVVRAGLGMLAAALDLFGDAEVGFVGLRRDEETFEPAAYMNTVPADLDGRRVLVLDPMLATGGSLLHACELLRASNAGVIDVVCVLAAPEGVTAAADAGTIDSLTTAAIDERLDERAFIVPGLGDAGDRQFGLQ